MLMIVQILIQELMKQLDLKQNLYYMFQVYGLGRNIIGCTQMVSKVESEFSQ
jgi:hypothetical protein